MSRLVRSRRSRVPPTNTHEPADRMSAGSVRANCSLSSDGEGERVLLHGELLGTDRPLTSATNAPDAVRHHQRKKLLNASLAGPGMPGASWSPTFGAGALPAGTSLL